MLCFHWQDFLGEVVSIRYDVTGWAKVSVEKFIGTKEHTDIAGDPVFGDGLACSQ